jgi:N-acetylglucosamine-6-sulfatase
MADSGPIDRWLRQSLSRRQALQTLGRVSAAGLAASAGLTGLAGWADPSRAQTPAPGAASGAPPAEPVPARPLNLLFILSDDHRYDHLSLKKHPFLVTPFLDRLAEQGILFENAFVTTSLCSPSRASFLTGTYAHTHGVKNNLTPWNNQNITLLERMKQAGYMTAFIGKWHMPGRLPQLRGVDRFVTFNAQGGQGQYYDCPLIVNGETVNSRKRYITEELTDHALEFIQENKDKPFALYLCHKAVHHQFLPPPDLENLYSNAPVRFPSEMDPLVMMTRGNILYGTLGSAESLYRHYCATITALDREIGRLIDRLDELGLKDNTLVVYASDNGYFWGEHNLVDKRYAYEESIRVPFIVRCPARIPDPGRRAPQMVLNVDLVPTVLDLCGLPASGPLEGRSFAPILASPDAPGRTAWLYEYFRDYPYRVPPHVAVRTDRYKYIEFPHQPPELFDLAQDPREHHNLAAAPESQALLGEMRTMLKSLKRG